MSRRTFKVSASFEWVTEMDEDNYEEDCPLDSVIAAARERPDDWALGELLDLGEMTAFMIVEVTP